MFYLLFNQTLLKLGDNDWVGWINVLPASTWRDNVLGGAFVREDSVGGLYPWRRIMSIYRLDKPVHLV
jgi:hypothetical protein